MNLVRRLAFVLVFVSLAWTTVPGLAHGVRQALDLWPLSLTERRARLFGPFYESVLRVGATLPAKQPVALVLERADDVDPALFLNYYLFPRPAKLYFGLGEYRMDPKGPRRIVRIHIGRSPEARLMTYEAVRAEEIGSDHVVQHFDLQEETARSFVVPLVSSGDGPPPDVYTTEAVMENAGSAAARVNVRMYPANHTAQVILEPGERRTWNDLVYQLYSRLDAGWLEIESDQPLRARFWFVNRARTDADVVEFARFFRSATINVPVGGRLWVLNPHDRELPVRLNGGDHKLPPRSLIPLVWVGEARLQSADEWYALVSWRDAAGKTYFRWPEVR